MKKQSEPTVIKKIYDRLAAENKVKNQTEFAGQLGYEKSPFSRIINTGRPMTMRLLENLYSKFDVNINFIVSKGRGNMFLSDVDKITRQDLEVVTELKEQNQRQQQEIERLKNAIADKDLIIELFKTRKA